MNKMNSLSYLLSRKYDSELIPYVPLRMASHKLPRSTTVFRPLPACLLTHTPALLHALLDRVDGCARHPDKACDLTHFVSRTKKYRIFHSIVSLQIHFEICNNNKPFSSMSQSQSIEWVKQKPDNNYQATRIVTKNFVQLFSARPVIFVKLINE